MRDLRHHNRMINKPPRLDTHWKLYSNARESRATFTNIRTFHSN